MVQRLSDKRCFEQDWKLFSLQDDEKIAMTCTSLAHDLKMTCTLLAHDLQMTCKWLAHDWNVSTSFDWHDATKKL